jgi:hypothetical protein
VNHRRWVDAFTAGLRWRTRSQECGAFLTPGQAWTIPTHPGHTTLLHIDSGQPPVEPCPPHALPTAGRSHLRSDCVVDTVRRGHEGIAQLLHRRPEQESPKGDTGDMWLHRGPIGFANLLVSMRDETIVFDPHVTGSCVIFFDEDGARTLRDILTEWLG